MSKQFTIRDHELMHFALDLAKKAFGKTRPNPMVGAVLVKNGKVIGEGYHHRAGAEHAELLALKGFSAMQLSGADLYVTLEPCCHFGKKTPPCVDFIIKSGLKSVIVACNDPNPRVNGKGILALRKAGIKVKVGLLEKESAKLNETFFKYISTSLPFVVVKLAMSFDGKIATASGDSKWISGELSRKYGHKLRAFYDAVMTSSKTILKDDAHLGVRMVKGKDPLRVVVDRKLVTSISAKVYRDQNVMVATTKAASARNIAIFRKAGINLKIYDVDFKIKEILEDLGKLGIQGVMVEAGGTFAAALIKEQLVDKFLFFYSPIIIGDNGISGIGELSINKISEALKLKDISTSFFENDILAESYPQY